jgi:hypothetical protein
MSIELGYQGIALALDCGNAPEQTSQDWEAEVDAAVAKIGPVSGGAAKTKLKKENKDLLGKLPDAGKLYMELKMLHMYCSSLRDDKAISESRKSEKLRAYFVDIRGAIGPKQPAVVPPPSKQEDRTKEGSTQSPVNPPVTTPTQAERERTAKLEKELFELQERIKPRRITDAQRATLIKALTKSPKGPVTIATPIGDAEAQMFARQIREILESSGWKSVRFTQNLFKGTPVGLSVNVRDGNKVPLFVEMLRQAFESSGIPIYGAYNPELTDEAVQLLVGMKP